jgi:hypothetical protein
MLDMGSGKKVPITGGCLCGAEKKCICEKIESKYQRAFLSITTGYFLMRIQIGVAPVIG